MDKRIERKTNLLLESEIKVETEEIDLGNEVIDNSCQYVKKEFDNVPVSDRECDFQNKIESSRSQNVINLACHICNKKYIRKASLIKHILSHNVKISKRINFCELCKSTFTNPISLVHHLRNIHNCQKNDNGDYIMIDLKYKLCNECVKQVQNYHKEIKEKRITKHTVPCYHYKCYKCSCVFKTVFKMDNHWKEVHEININACKKMNIAAMDSSREKKLHLQQTASCTTESSTSSMNEGYNQNIKIKEEPEDADFIDTLLQGRNDDKNQPRDKKDLSYPWTSTARTSNQNSSKNNQQVFESVYLPATQNSIEFKTEQNKDDAKTDSSSDSMKNDCDTSIKSPEHVEKRKVRKRVRRTSKSLILNKHVSVALAKNPVYKIQYRYSNDKNKSGKKIKKECKIKNKYEYTCSKCKAIFPWKLDLHKHKPDICSDYLTKNIPCLFCQQIISDGDELEIHIKNEHNACKICFEVFKNSEELNIHIKNHQDGLVQFFQCTKCYLDFKDMSLLKEHYKIVHSLDDVLVVNFKTIVKPYIEKELPEHLQMRQRMPIIIPKCPYCGIVLKINLLGSHMLNKHKIKICESCQNKFIYNKINDILCSNCKEPAENLVTNKINEKIETSVKSSAAENSDVTFKCEHCFTGFTKSTELYSHSKKNIHQNVNLPCLYCGEICEDTQKLDEHIINVHIACKLCDLHFTSKISLEKHKAEHAKSLITRYLCSSCGIEFKTASKYSIHFDLPKSKCHYHCLYYTAIKKVILDIPFQSDYIKPQCSYCNVFFLKDCALESHCKKFHDIHICQNCSCNFLYRPKKLPDNCPDADSIIIPKKCKNCVPNIHNYGQEYLKTTLEIHA